MNVGILGGGQLARMLALAGHPLGCTFTVLDPALAACAASVANHIIGAYSDTGKLEELADSSDVITYEFENVPAESLRFLENRLQISPPSEALACSRDRLVEKTLFIGQQMDGRFRIFMFVSRGTEIKIRPPVLAGFRCSQ